MSSASSGLKEGLRWGQNWGTTITNGDHVVGAVCTGVEDWSIPEVLESSKGIVSSGLVGIVEGNRQLRTRLESSMGIVNELFTKDYLVN